MITVHEQTEVMTLEELAGFLRVSESIVRKYADRGWLPGRQIGGHWRFSRLAVQQWLRGRSPKESILGQAGAFEDDPDDLDEVRAAVLRKPDPGELAGDR